MACVIFQSRAEGPLGPDQNRHIERLMARRGSSFASNGREASRSRGAARGTILTRPGTTGRYVLAGALHGAVVWGTYAVIEQLLCIATPLWDGFESVPAPSYWRVIAVVISSFVVLGLALGAACGLALKILDDRGVVGLRLPTAERFRRAAVVTLALASALHWPLVRPFNKMEALSLAVSVALAVGLVLCEKYGSWGERLGSLGNPWVASLLMFGGVWVGRRMLEKSVPLIRGGGAVATLLIVGCVGAIGSRLWRTRRLPADSFLPVRAAAVVSLMGVVVLGLGPSITRWGLAPPQPLQSRAAAGRPNVILITMDTVRADHLSLYGYGRDTTPFLKELAKGATVYDEAIATSNMTLTTHASLFTGLYGSWHGAHFTPPELPSGRPLGRRHPTLAQILSADGYRTMAVVANSVYLRPEFGLTRGFQMYHVLTPVVASSRLLLRSHLGSLVDALVSSDELGAFFSRAEEVNQAVSRVLTQAKRDPVPFLLFVNYMDAHEMYVPPAPFNTIFPGRDRSLRYRAYRAMRFHVMGGDRPISPEERGHFVSQYDGSIRYLDSRLARLVSQLKDLGLFENSLIVITSDHGEEFGEHTLVGHGYSLFQNEVHVPLIIKYPHQDQPRVIGTVVSQVDVMPTVLSALDLKIPEEAQGESLQGVDHDTSRFVMSESFPNGTVGPRFVRFLRMDRAVYSGRMKLIALGNGGQELFDLSRDPEEVSGQVRPNDAGATALAAYLDDWLKSKPSDSHEKLDEETLRRLRSLGYVQ